MTSLLNFTKSINWYQRNDCIQIQLKKELSLNNKSNRQKRLLLNGLLIPNKVTYHPVAGNLCFYSGNMEINFTIIMFKYN